MLDYINTAALHDQCWISSTTLHYMINTVLHTCVHCVHCIVIPLFLLLYTNILIPFKIQDMNMMMKYLHLGLLQCKHTIFCLESGAQHGEHGEVVVNNMSVKERSKL